MKIFKKIKRNLEVLILKSQDFLLHTRFVLLNQKKKRGQGLIEYLIIIAIMGVASIGILRTLNQTVKSRFANAIYALQGRKQKASTHNLRKTEYQRSDFSNFMTGAASTDNKNKKIKK